MLPILNNIKNKLYRNFTDYGFLILLRKIVSGILEIFYKNSNTVIYQLNIKDNCREFNYMDNLTFALISGKDHLSLKKIEKIAEWLKGKLGPDILTEKRICMSVFEKEKLVGFYVAAFREIFLPVLLIKIILKHDEAWGEEIMIDKKYRGRCVAGALKHRIYIELQNRGIESIYGCVGLYNKASLRSAAKFQLKKINFVKLVKILNSIKVIFSEVPMDLRGPTILNQKEWRRPDLGDVNRKTFRYKGKSLLNLKDNNSGDNMLKIKTSDLFN